MHQLNVLILGSNSFFATLNELKPFLKFNPILGDLKLSHDAILFHENALKEQKSEEFINKSKSIKICASVKKNLLINYDAILELPSTLKEINLTVENITAKKIFNKNSSIKIKNYFLNKNERKLSKDNKYIILTEKEIQLLELFLNFNKPIPKNEILSTVWNYSSDADTHTVETHIYRLRKKIYDEFLDEDFIHNYKNGYSL